jgi:hypothetical protein
LGKFKGSAPAPNVMSAVSRIFEMTWLWSIFAGFYLVAYAFWVPSLSANPVVVIGLVGLTVLLGLASLYDGFSTAMAVGSGSRARALPLRRLRRFAGGVILLAYLPVYIPSQGRIVAHWPLDLAITVVSGVVMLVYGILNQ